MAGGSRPIALLDSGLGGLTVLHALRALAPEIDVVYFADTAYVPYGDRPLDEVAALGARIVVHLEDFDPLAIVIASGTTCAAFDARGWPTAAVPLIGVIDAGAVAAVAATASGSIGVIATKATIDSGCFERALRERAPGSRVTNVAAPALVPIVEAGQSASESARVAVRAACAAFTEARCDAVILGCTHFPHLGAWFAQALGPRVALVDPADECAARVKAMIDAESRAELKFGPLQDRAKAGKFICEVSGDEQAFARFARMLGAPSIDRLAHVPLAG